MRAWQVVRYGKPSEALELRELAAPEPGPREILVRTTASVCNYNEVDGCHGRYLTINPPLPYTLGMEYVGEVVGAGPGAEDWIGKRVMACGRGARGVGGPRRGRSMAAPRHAERRRPGLRRRHGQRQLRRLAVPAPRPLVARPGVGTVVDAGVERVAFAPIVNALGKPRAAG